MAIRRTPITRVVIIEGVQPDAWTVKVYDSSGHLRSGITSGSTREYVEQKVSEWFSGVPVEYKFRPQASKRDPKMSSGRRRELYRRAMAMPPITSERWRTFYDPMSNGKRTVYEILFEDRTYTILPIYGRQGRFEGYALNVTPGARGLHAGIDPVTLEEDERYINNPIFRRPQEAAAVARKYAEREGYA